MIILWLFINYPLVVREPWLRGEGETVHGIPAGDASWYRECLDIYQAPDVGIEPSTQDSADMITEDVDNSSISFTQQVFFRSILQLPLSKSQKNVDLPIDTSILF